MPSKTYANFKNDIGDIVKDSSWISDNPDKILRALNRNLADIDIGEIGEDQTHIIAYDFQREDKDIPFTTEITGTQTGATSATILIDSAASFITKGISVGDDVENTTDGSVARVVSVDSATQITTSGLKNGSDNTFVSADAYRIKGIAYKIAASWNFKFPHLLRLAQDHDIEFSYVSPEYFERKKFVSVSQERIFTVDYLNGTYFLKINYDTTENMNLVFYSHNIVLNTDGSTRQMTVANDGDIFLIPDEFYPVILELASGELLKQINGEDSVQALSHIAEGRKRLKRMMNAIGIYQKQSVVRMRPRNEWPKPLFRISRT